MVHETSDSFQRLFRRDAIGVALDDVHGLGSLTVEVLSRMGAKFGVKTKVYRIQPDKIQDALSHIYNFLVSDENSPEYEVVSQ